MSDACETAKFINVPSQFPAILTFQERFQDAVSSEGRRNIPQHRPLGNLKHQHSKQHLKK